MPTLLLVSNCFQIRFEVFPVGQRVTEKGGANKVVCNYGARALLVPSTPLSLVLAFPPIAPALLRRINCACVCVLF